MSDLTATTTEAPAAQASGEAQFIRAANAARLGIARRRQELAAQTARLEGQPAEGKDGRRGMVLGVAFNCHQQIMATLQAHKGGRVSYYAEDLRTAAELGYALVDGVWARKGA